MYIDRELRKDMEIEIEADLLGACDESAARYPLAGVRVLDLTRLLPGPVATLHLADLGAEVIKIEDPEAGDYARTMGLGSTGEDSAYFRMINRNKRGLRLDLKQPAGVDVFLRLARDADVIVESFRPGVVDKLGRRLRRGSRSSTRRSSTARSPATGRTARSATVPATTSTTSATPAYLTRSATKAASRRFPTCRSPTCSAAR